MAGAHFDEMVATKPTPESWKPAAGLEKADRKYLLPVSAYSGYSQSPE